MKIDRKPITKKEPIKDTNLLQFIFHVARNDELLKLLLREIQFIRDHPAITEADIRHELAMTELINMPVKANEKLPKQ